MICQKTVIEVETYQTLINYQHRRILQRTSEHREHLGLKYVSIHNIAQHSACAVTHDVIILYHRSLSLSAEMSVFLCRDT